MIEIGINVIGYNASMRKRSSTEDLSIEELRRLLIEKRRPSRQERLERYRKSGRVVLVAPDITEHTLDGLRTTAITESITETNFGDSPRKRFIDGFLLFVEVVAVIGFIYILLNGITIIRALNKEVAVALEQPTLTPTPLIMAVVLPSGHTPPTSPGGARPNEEEIPQHLRPLVQSLANIPIPTPGPEQAIRIQIPAIAIDAPIVQGDSWEQLKKGVGQHIGTGNPGQNTNLVLSAHNDVFGEIFRDLDQLKAGDTIIIYTNQRSYKYIVTSSQVVEPTNVEALKAGTRPMVTLISCYPYLVDNKRIVVVAYMQSSNN